MHLGVTYATKLRSHMRPTELLFPRSILLVVGIVSIPSARKISSLKKVLVNFSFLRITLVNEHSLENMPRKQFHL